MSTLHVVNKSPFERNSLKSCVDHLSDGDSILLIEDAVVAARGGSSITPVVQDALKKGPVYVLGPDLTARAIKQDAMIAGLKLVDYAGFVDLAVSHKRTQTWM